MPLPPIWGLGRLESWFSFGTHHDTGPGRPDGPTTETLLLRQPRDGINENRDWGSGRVPDDQGAVR